MHDEIEARVERVQTRELLAEYTVLLNRHGVDSEEAAEYLEQHKADQSFVQLAETSRWLKKALNAPVADPV